jgi:hypothetical protein
MARPVSIRKAFAPIPAVFSDFTGESRFEDMMSAPSDELIQIRPSIKRDLRRYLSLGVLGRREEFTARLVSKHESVIGITPRLGPEDINLLEPKAVETILSETWRICGSRAILGAAGIVVSNAIGWQTCLALNAYLTAQSGPEVALPASIALYLLSWGIFGLALWIGGKSAKSLAKAAVTKCGVSMRNSAVDVDTVEKTMAHLVPKPENHSIAFV